MLNGACKGEMAESGHSCPLERLWSAVVQRMRTSGWPFRRELRAMETQRIDQEIQEKLTGPTDTRRELFWRGAMMVSAGVLAGPFAAACARASEQAQTENQAGAKPAASGQTLYDRLGGIFAIAGVVNYFSDEIIKDPVAGAQSKNPA
ncbi:MAG TPA: hypothetical protein VFT40_00535, partial [Sphingomicrobium sp.]|nr:hypothetical protein [Sphingomicrobium sp.]